MARIPERPAVMDDRVVLSLISAVLTYACTESGRLPSRLTLRQNLRIHEAWQDSYLAWYTSAERL